MSDTIASTGWHSPVQNAGLPAALLLVAWLVAVLILGAKGAFLGAQGAPPIALLVAFVTPIAAFVIALRTSTAFRAFVLNIDPRMLAAMQAWRLGGFAFIALFAHGILPGYFAWPAGLGDMAIGLAAPRMLAGLMRSPGFASSRTFVAWNLLGLLDLFVAVSLGAAGAMIAGNAGAITTAPMAELPLLLIPAYFVPIFIMMHFASLMQARRRAA
ncbi:MAG TPA: hypothetical protein VLK83_12225 [Rhodanobacteraceae bacterium]|nr:hypothetical protein [Rhodanobacteraceae bacterium]